MTKHLKKQLTLIANLAQTILQTQLHPTDQLIQHLKTIRQNIKYMYNNNCYEQGIMQMLINNQRYQIKNNINKYITNINHNNNREIFICIIIYTFQKNNGCIWNQQLWEFCIDVSQRSSNGCVGKSSHSIIQFIQHVLKYLQCSTLTTLNKIQKNLYINDHKVIISQNSSAIDITHFSNLSTFTTLLSTPTSSCLTKLTSKYFYNHKKTQQHIKQLLMTRSLSTTKTSNKNSIQSTQTSIPLNFLQYYDEQLDITLLTTTPLQQHLQSIYTNINNSQQQQFQLLIQQTKQQDKQFLINNDGLFNQLNFIFNSYL